MPMTPQTPEYHWDTHSVADFIRGTGRDLFEKARNFSSFSRSVKAEGIYAYRIVSEERDCSRTLIQLPNGERVHVVDAASNDYLALARDARVKAAVVDAVNQFGAGAQGAGMLNGNTPVHLELERALATFLGREDASISPSGYASMMGVTQGLLRPTDVAFCDRYSHMSLLDGITASAATLYRYPHLDVKALDRLLADHRGRFHGAMIVSDGVFSADGAIAPVDELVQLAQKYECQLLIDDAHAIGTINGGRASAPHTGVDLIAGVFSKALGGQGGFVAGSRAVVEYVRLYGSAVCGTTNLSVPNAAAALAALQIVQSEPWRIERLQTIVRALRQGLAENGVETGQSDAPIVSVIRGQDSDALRTWRSLLDQGVLGQALPFPIVPRGKARLRLRVNVGMTDDDVNTIVDAMTVACQTPRTAVRVSRPAFASLTALGFASHSIETRLGPIVAHTRGTGPCCVFLHPLLFGSEVYDEVFKCLPPSMRLVALDLWGHGAAGPAVGPVTLTDAAHALADVLPVLHPGDGPLAVCGTSLGGMVALRLALRCNERIDRLLLVGTSADPEEGPARRTFEALLDVGASLGAAAVVPDVMGAMLSHRFCEIAPQHVNAIAEYLGRQSAADVRPVVEAVLRRESIRSELPNIRAEGLVVVGESDLAEPPPHSEALSAAMPAALLFPVPNAGHLLPIERPELVAELVRRILAR